MGQHMIETPVRYPQMPQAVRDHDNGLRQWNIMTVFRGSHAHGMYIPPTDPNGIDDIDIAAICVPPKDHYIGLKEYGSRGTKDFWVDEWDVVVYEARKAIGLLLKGNPNMLSLLWCPEEAIISISQAGQHLRESRGVFTSKAVSGSFIGYAYGQFKRITHWREEGRYKTGHMGAKRKALVEQFGYDTKNAAHALRILRMGIEFMETGVLQVERTTDRDELLSIKRGDWALEAVTALVESTIERAHAAIDQSQLPPEMDTISANQLCCQVIEMAHKTDSRGRSG